VVEAVAVIPQDFFESAELAELVANPWDSSLAEDRFDVSLVQSLRARPLENRTDLEAAIALAALVHDELMAYGTGGGQRLSDEEVGLSLSALRAVTKRLGVAFEPPYRNFTTFRTYWLRNDAHGSWQARRDLLETLFEPLHRELIRMEELTFEGLAQAVSPKHATGWSAVDQEITELRRRFLTCQTASDYRDVGNRCVVITELLGDVVYNPTLHLREHEKPPGRGETKKRLDRYIETQLHGSENADARALARSVVVFAQAVKHRSAPTRREAGISADAVIGECSSTPS
jgi:hypothetical protein